MSSVNQAEVRQRWAGRGFSCDLWVDSSERVWNDFVHECDELVMLVEGEEEFEMNKRKYYLQIGEELLIPAAQPTPLATSEGRLLNGCTATSASKSIVGFRVASAIISYSVSYPQTNNAVKA